MSRQSGVQDGAEPAQLHYPRPAVTVDLLVFTINEGKLWLLLVERGREPFAGAWALPGGFVNINESLVEAARRELYEETGVTDVHLEQLHTYGDPDRDPRGRVITVAYLALTGPDAVDAVRAGDDANAARWFATTALPPLAFDHAKIVKDARLRLQEMAIDVRAAFYLLPPAFTLGELQQALEIIRRTQLDKRNFRRKLLAQGLVEETEALRYGDHRPAKLYRPTTAALDS